MNDQEFEDLYTTMLKPIVLMGSRRLGAESAREIAAETFEVAWRTRGEFPTDRRSWPGWLVGIAKNKIRQEKQRVSRKHHDNRFAEDWVSDEDHPLADDPVWTVAHRDSALRVYGALSPAERRLFDVAFIKELSADIAAEVLGISVTAFTSRLSRLRMRMRDLQACQDGVAR